jgi:IMP dehydrogenase
MHDLLLREALTTDDVLLVPQVGKLNSRKDAKMSFDPYIYSAPMDCVTGVELAQALANLYQSPVLSRFNNLNSEQSLEAARKFFQVFIAVGLDSYEEFLNQLSKFNSGHSSILKLEPNIALDVAHGTTPAALEAYTRLYQHSNKLMSGSVCTPAQARAAYEAGCSHIRIGIGPGSACTTRIATGCGFPQLSAVHNIYSSFTSEELNNITLIADGGIRNSGDIVKYLAAGANAVMLGSMLANAKESAGWKVEENEIGEEVKYKYYRGQASAEFHKDILKREENYIEGVTTRKIMYKDAKPARDILAGIDAGIRSAISYLGLTSIKEINPANTEFIKITQNGMKESDARPL